MTDLERRIKAKIPGEDTGIEVKRSLCAICSPGHHCGVDCYVKDGKIIRVEGTQEHPYNHGKLCTKGSSLRNYVYRADRIKTPLKRVGKRGEGKFEPISWDEAYAIIAENLLKTREKYGASSVAFFSGYCKWYRPILHRMAHVFGSVNFATDDSTCVTAKILGDKCTAGCGAGPDMGHANTFLGWNFDGYYSSHLSVAGVQKLKERGGKVIIIDIRDTPASKNLADIFLKINPGTDGALALGMGKIIIDNGWADMDYVEKYTYGFEEYKALVQQYPLDKVAEITGLDPDMIMEATKLYATNGPACTNYSASALVHHINGFNSHRAIVCLSALTGNFDRVGGNVPNPPTYLHKPAGFATREHEFRSNRYPKDGPERIGAERFPIWNALYDEFQAVDLLRQLEEQKPYPVKAIMGFGMNAKMLPETDKLLAAMADNLDFFVNTDLFMTITCKYADIVLPACSSVERGELKAYQGGYLTFTKPVIEPLYESRSDVDIMCDLVRKMDLDDDLLKQGYEDCMDWIIDGCGLTVADLKKSDMPVKVPIAKWPAQAGKVLANGFKTPSGKFEFYSNAIAQIDPRLDPLPSYSDSLADQNDSETKEKYPFYLCTGARLANTLHSRIHEVPWLRSLRPDPTVEVHSADAARLGIKNGDWVEMYSPYGSIQMRVKTTGRAKPGVLMTIHGYTEANVNELIGRNHVDPYSGFPGFKGMRCNIRKVQEDQ